MLTAATISSLRDVVSRRDIDGLAAYIVERYETLVADDHVGEMLSDLGLSGLASEHYLDARLRNSLKRLGYFDRLLGSPELFDVHRVWNLLHLPWEQSLETESEQCDEQEPQYARTKAFRTLEKIRPVNRVAHRVAPEPAAEVMSWRCEQCRKPFRNLAAMKLHVQDVHGDDLASKSA